MDKKLFAELMEGLNQMADHAAGKKVKGIREAEREVRPPTVLSSHATPIRPRSRKPTKADSEADHKIDV